MVACLGVGVAGFLPSRTINWVPEAYTKSGFEDDSGVTAALALATLILLAVNRRRTDIAAVVTAGVISIIGFFSVWDPPWVTNYYPLVVKRWGMWVGLLSAVVATAMALICVVQRRSATNSVPEARTVPRAQEYGQRAP